MTFSFLVLQIMCQRSDNIDDEIFQELKTNGQKWDDSWWVHVSTYEFHCSRPAISRKCMSCDQNACVIVRTADPMCR